MKIAIYLLLGLAAGAAGAQTPGDTAAQVDQGRAHIEGDGVPVDAKKAAQLFRAAAELGNADGQFNLGLLYIRGAGVPQDDVEAYKWLTLAHEGGREDALSVRDGMAGDMTPAQLGEARRLARNWKPTEE